MQITPRASRQCSPKTPSYTELLKNLKCRTGIRLILNTSFNFGGKPIIESPADAVATFSKMAINALVLDRFLVLKGFSPSLHTSGLLPPDLLESFVVVDNTREVTPEERHSVPAVLRWLQRATGQVVFVRSGFPLYGEYLDWLCEGRKVTTIRFRKGGVEFPSNYQLSLFATTDYTLKRAPMPTINVQVEGVKYQRFGELTEEDALRDGFRTHNEMVKALTTIYPALNAEDWVTVYRISPIMPR